MGKLIGIGSHLDEIPPLDRFYRSERLLAKSRLAAEYLTVAVCCVLVSFTRHPVASQSTALLLRHTTRGL